MAVRGLARQALGGRARLISTCAPVRLSPLRPIWPHVRADHPALRASCFDTEDFAQDGYAHWRLADLPRYLAAEQVNRLIAACDGEVGAPLRLPLRSGIAQERHRRDLLGSGL